MKKAYFSEEEVGETESTNELFEGPVSVEGVIGSHQDVFIHSLLEINGLEWSKKLPNIQTNSIIFLHSLLATLRCALDLILP